MKKKASVSGTTGDLSSVKGQQPCDYQNPGTRETPPAIGDRSLDHDQMNYNFGYASPRGGINLSGFNNSTDDNSSVHFLRICFFCHCRLSPGHDTYMYRGDKAFCSKECREQTMEQDKRKKKCTTAGGSGDRRKEK